MIAGIVHHVTNVKLNPDCNDFADIQFYLANATIVLLETVLVQIFYFDEVRTSSKFDARAKNRIEKSLQYRLACFAGYVWVSGFFVWLVPKMYYARLYCGLERQLKIRQAGI